MPKPIKETPVPVTVSILDRDFQIMSPPSERHSLMDAVQLVDDKMRDIRNTGKVIGMDRMAVLVAINLAHDFLSNNGSTENYAADINKKISKLNDKISYSLSQYKQLEL